MQQRDILLALLLQWCANRQGITKNLTLSVLPKAPQQISSRAKSKTQLGEHSAISSALVLVKMTPASWRCETLKIPSWQVFLIVPSHVSSSGNRSHSGMWTSVSFWFVSTVMMNCVTRAESLFWPWEGAEVILNWGFTTFLNRSLCAALAQSASSFLGSGKSELPDRGPVRPGRLKLSSTGLARFGQWVGL